MKSKLEKGEISQLDIEIDSADIIICELLFKNKSRYENQARKLLELFSIDVRVGTAKITYKLAVDGSSLKGVINENGASREFGWTRLYPADGHNAERIALIFASDEAALLAS